MSSILPPGLTPAMLISFAHFVELSDDLPRAALTDSCFWKIEVLSRTKSRTGRKGARSMMKRLPPGWYANCT